VPRRVAAPLDRVDAQSNLRLRHLPGEVCLACHDRSVPDVEPTDVVVAAIAAARQGSPVGLSILKARSEVGREAERCPDCGSPREARRIDAGLGPYASIVLGGLSGSWCPRCASAALPDQGQEVRARLAELRLDGPGTLVPSLVYDTVEHPTSLQIEVTTRCNLRCEYCSHRLLEVHQDVSPSRFSQMLDAVDCRYLDNVDLTGLGEPLLHRGLPGLVRHLRERGSPTHLRVVTNGTVLTKDTAMELCEAGITSIAFSIDSLDPQRFERSRGGARLERVLANLEALVRLRESHGYRGLSIKIKSVLLEDPAAEAERILSYSARLGLEMPHFSRLDSRAAAGGFYEQSWLRDPFDDSTPSTAFVAWVEDRWKELGGAEDARPARPENDLPVVGYRHPLLRPQDLCRWAVDAAFLAGNGRALACCEQMIDRPRIEWGSLETQSLADLWNGSLLWGYRLPLSLGLVPRACVGCSWAPTHGLPLEG
jgi:sulfatase maturation enzyme AslB (radical SAM superfamily)